MMDEEASKAERIRASRGNYEAEVTCTGEAGLHQCALLCAKNPGHNNFIPTKKFNIEHLPSRYRSRLLVDYVRATSDITCRLSGSHISEDRPETWPDSEKAFPFSASKREDCNMVGTGWVRDVIKYTEEMNRNCQYYALGEVHIITACHVVFDDEEARHTKCQFFYDSHETDINKVLTLTGLQVVERDIKGDMCVMKYVTHDLELLDRFDKMRSRGWDLRRKVLDKYVSNMSSALSVPGVVRATNVDHNLCIIVSHPHGCTKMVSVGTWKHRQVVDKPYDWKEHIAYNYNTPTCPGSSGAAILTLCRDHRWSAGCRDLPPHSQGGPGNDNSSGTGWEFPN